MLTYQMQYLILYNVLLLVVILEFFNNVNRRELIKKGNSNGIILLVFMVSIIAFRDWNSPGFGDSVAYGKYFEYAYTPQSVWYAKSKFFGYLYYYWSQYGLSPEFFFFVSACFYCLPMYFLSKIFARPYDAFFMLIFFACSFGWYSFGVNGIRNGWAIAMLIWCFLAWYKKKYIISLACIIFAWCIHGSSMIAIAGIVGAYFYKKPKQAFKIWIVCFLVSLAVGSTVQEYLSSFGFINSDGGGYLVHSMNDTSSTAAMGGVFRWDFVGFSVVPILWGLYSLKTKCNDSKQYLFYQFLLCSYIYANAIWLLAIRAAYTNRIAQLSWWMIPIIVAFPILRFDFTKRGRIWAYALLCCFSFTYLMYLIQ